MDTLRDLIPTLRTDASILFRLAVAIVLGGLIDLERFFLAAGCTAVVLRVVRHLPFEGDQQARSWPPILVGALPSRIRARHWKARVPPTHPRSHCFHAPSLSHCRTSCRHLADADPSTATRCRSLAAMVLMTWEYLLVRWTTTREGLPVVFEVDGAAMEMAPLVEKLREIGGQGWELAGVGDDAGHTLFFKRPAST